MTFALMVLVLFGCDERYIPVAHGLTEAQCWRMADNYNNATCAPEGQ